MLTDTRLVLLSAGVELDPTELERAGVEHVLSKPVRSSALLDVLLEILPPEPAVVSKPAASAGSAAPPAPVGDRGRVLVVEDNPISQLVAQGHLTELGFRADVVANGAEAVEAVAAADYTVVLMDCHMPVMDGFAATAEIRRRQGTGPRVPIVALTASALPEQVEAARQAGIRASAALPLTRRNFVVGTLNLYAAETGVFDAQTCALLEEMAKDVSFALENFDREALRRQAEESVREREILFRSVVEQNIAAIFMLDGGRFVFANPRACEILGYAPGELDGREVMPLIAEEDRAEVAEMLRAVLAGEVESVERNLTGLRKDGGTVDIGARATRAHLENKPVILGVAQDIGERRRRGGDRALHAQAGARHDGHRRGGLGHGRAARSLHLRPRAPRRRTGRRPRRRAGPARGKPSPACA